MKQWISYAQQGEDILLARALPDVLNGFYVDVGAFDPWADSVTKHFYDNGWSGINVEPGPGFPHLMAERGEKVNVCVHCGKREPGDHSLCPTCISELSPELVGAR